MSTMSAVSSARIPTVLRVRGGPAAAAGFRGGVASVGSTRKASKAFGVKAAPAAGGASMMGAVHKVKLITESGDVHEFEAPDDMYILDSAESAGIDLPYSCRAGACSTCAGKLESGTVDQGDGSFLDENQMGAGYLLTCVSYPTSDCVIHTHKESDLY